MRVTVINLSKRQSEVLSLLAAGYTIAEIAEMLFISTRMIDTHIFSAKKKLNARTTEHAIAMAVSSGLIELQAEQYPLGEQA
jgi:DNA-binding CsgD family transcriptional regulator